MSDPTRPALQNARFIPVRPEWLSRWEDEESCKRLSRGASATERAWLFGGTAEELYRLEGL